MRSTPVSRSLRLTPAGHAVVIVASCALILSLVTGSAAGLLAAFAGALLVCNALAARWNLRRVSLLSPPAATGFATAPFRLWVPLRNHSGWFPARDLRLYHGSLADGKLVPAALVPRLAPLQTLELATVCRLPRRGRYPAYWATVACSGPLGLTEARASHQVKADLLALPRMGSLRDLALPGGAGGSALHRTRRRPFPGEELAGLRDWREGLSRRHVHWRVSAHRGRLVVRELEGDDLPRLHVVLAGDVKDPPGPGQDHRGFELAVSFTATLLEQLFRKGHPVRFSLTGDRGVALPPARGRAGLFPILRVLAETRPAPRSSRGSAPPGAGPARAEEYTVVVRAGGTGSRAGDARLRTRGRVLDVESPITRALFRWARTEERPW